jgi:hypothetical protein
MAAILHYNQIEGEGEYIVITEEAVAPELIEDLREHGYEFYASYDLDDAGTLPTERSLRAS